MSSGVLVRVERGKDHDVLELIDADGNVVLLRGWGVHPDEQRRTREAALQLILGVLATAPPATKAEGPARSEEGYSYPSALKTLAEVAKEAPPR